MGVGVGVGAGAGICLELETEPEISKMGITGNPDFENWAAELWTPDRSSATGSQDKKFKNFNF